MGNLFQRVKDTIKGQSSKFCTRSTRVTLLTKGRVEPDEIGYTNCDGVLSGVTYDVIVSNNNYIPDCVRGGSPITSKNGYKYFVQYGTTDCNTPSGTNKTLFPCGGLGEGVVVDTTGYNLTQDNVYEMLLNPLNGGPTPIIQCYTVGKQTDLQASYNISGPVGIVQDCSACGVPAQINRVLTSCGGDQFIVDTRGAKIIEGSVYQIQLSGPVTLQCYTIGRITDITPTYTIVGVYGSQLQDCNSCGGTPTPTVTTLLRTYSVQVSSFGSEPKACSSITATTSVYSTEPMAANVTFLYTDQQLTTPYYSNGYVLWIDKGNYVISTGTDGKVLSLKSCI